MRPVRPRTDSLSEAAFFYTSVPTGANPLYTIVVPGFIAINNTTGQKIVNPIAANYFRKLGPNYFFVRALTGLSKPAFDALLAGSLRAPGPINPYSDVNAQLSDGKSSYNALNLELKALLAEYSVLRYVHVVARDRRFVRPADAAKAAGQHELPAERASSLFDQRHRFVFSGVFSSPDSWRTGSGFGGSCMDLPSLRSSSTARADRSI